MASSLDNDEVARWAVRLDGEPLTDAEKRQLEIWLDADARRSGALLRAQAALSYLDRGRALTGAGVPKPNVSEVGGPRYHRRGLLIGGALGGLAAAGFGGFLLFSPGVDYIQTSLGEVRRVPLADGSIVSLNTESRIAVAMAKRVRHVTLEKGEAWFQVAHDKARPFIVEAGAVRVEAVGTAFSVRRRDNGVDVLVTEGAVESWVVGRETERRRISAGSQGFVAPTEATINVEQAPDKVDRALAWRTGEIIVDGESIAYAVDEINRYNMKKLFVDDPILAREPLVGYFRTDDPENFGRAVAAMSGAQVVVRGDEIHLVRGHAQNI